MDARLKKLLNRTLCKHVVRRDEALSHFPLPAAYLCQDCNAVGNDANTCPACASGVLMGLSAVLDRSYPSSEKMQITS
jgi:hypothetical protein